MGQDFDRVGTDPRDEILFALLDATEALFAAPQAQYTRDLLDAIPLPDPAQVWV